MNIQPNISSPTRRLLALGATGALAAAVLSGCSSHAESAGVPPPTVSAAPVLVKDVSQWDDYSGRIEAVDSVDLRPRVSGYIERVNYTEGQDVKKDDVLFTIDSRNYRADLIRAKAELARALSQSEQSHNEAERARTLSAQQAISTEVYEQRRAAAAVAQANVQAAEAAVDTARLNLEWTQVVAPISGRAGRALVTVGNLVTAGDASSVLTTLVSQNKVYVYFDADESSFLRYTEMTRKDPRRSERSGGLPVQVALADEQGFPHTGVVDFMDNRVDRNTGTIRMRAVLDNRDHVFTPGLFARVRLGSGHANAMLVDDKAVLTDQDRKYVYIVDATGKAQRRDVQLGRTADGLRIVEKGLTAGDRVIVNGVQKVFMPGMPVNAKPTAMEAQAVPAVAMN